MSWEANHVAARALMKGAPETVGPALRYGYDGQTVWVYSSNMGMYVVGTVQVAAGNMCRVVNEELGMDKWTDTCWLYEFVEPGTRESCDCDHDPDEEHKANCSFWSAKEHAP